MQKAHDELEARVQERTQALEITNEQLQTEVVERTQAEEALRSAYAYNRSLIEASLDPLVTITPEGKDRRCECSHRSGNRVCAGQS